MNKAKEESSKQIKSDNQLVVQLVNIVKAGSHNEKELEELLTKHKKKTLFIEGMPEIVSGELAMKLEQYHIPDTELDD